MPDFELLGLKDVAYLNSGVLLIDSRRFIETNLEKRCVDFVREHPDVSALYHDQSALNGVLRGDWKELSPTWNWMYNLWTLRTLEKQDPHIIHFTAFNKLWSKLNGEIPRRYCDEYRDFLSTHFPQEAQEMPAYQLSGKAKWRLRRYVLKNLYKSPKLKRYLTRFEKGSSK